MPITNQPAFRIRAMQQKAREMKEQGADPDEIIDRLSGFNLDEQSKQMFQQIKQAGASERGVSDFLKLKPQQESILSEEDFETKGALGGVSRFVGVEPLGRRIGTSLARLDPQQREIISSLEETDPESAELLKTGGVSGRELAGSIAQTGLTLAVPGAARALSAKGIGSRIAGEAGLGAAFGVAGEAQQEEFSPLRGAAFGATLGGALPLAGQLAKRVGKFGTEIITDLFERTTSVPQKALKEILSSSSKAQRQAIKNAAAGKTTSEKVAKGIQGAVNTLRTERDKIYQKGRQAIKELYPKAVDGAEQAFRNVKNQFKEIAEQRGVKFDGDEIVSIPPRTQKASASARTNIKKAWDSILKAEKAGDFSALKMDDLMQDFSALSRFERGVITDTTPVVNRIVGVAKENFGKIYPELGQLRKWYGDKSKVLGVLDDLLKTDKMDVRSLQSAANKVSKLFKENNSEYLQAVRKVDNILGTDFVKQAAGLSAQAESPGILRTALAIGGGAGLGAISSGSLSPAFLLLLPFFSPRAVQSVLRTASVAKPVKDAIMKGLTSDVTKGAGRALFGAEQANVGQQTERRTVSEVEERSGGVGRSLR